jgi:hypothetical protein
MTSITAAQQTPQFRFLATFGGGFIILPEIETGLPSGEVILIGTSFFSSGLSEFIQACEGKRTE